MFKKVIRILSNKIADTVLNKSSRDLDFAMQCMARDSSAKFILDNMQLAEKIYSRDEILKKASQLTEKIPGCVCEFGVFKGYTLRLLANSNKNKSVAGFDSFEGLPTDWRAGFSEGQFKTNIPVFKESNISIHQGWFNETIPKFLETLNQPIALLHIDCDLYESTKCVFDLLWDRLADDAIIVFDEYFNYPGWESHEHKALQEAINTTKRTITYLGYNPVGEQIMVKKI